MNSRDAKITEPILPSVFDLCRQMEIFRSIESDEIRAIENSAVTIEVSPDDEIEKILHLQEDLYIIRSGSIQLIRDDDATAETAVDFLHPGDCFGGEALELLLDMNFMLKAAEPTILCGLSAAMVESMNDRHPGFRRGATLQLSKCIIGAQSHFVNSLSTELYEARHEIKKLDQLTEASKVLNSSLDLERLLSLILHAAQEISDAKRGTLYLVDDESSEIYSKFVFANNISEIRLPIGFGLSGTVAQTGTILNIADAYNDVRFNPKIDERSGFRTKSVLCVPMKTKHDKVIGVLQLLNKRNGFFTTDDEEWIGALSDHAVIAIENARLYEQERQKQALEKEMRSARSVQEFLLPQSIPPIAGYDVAGMSIPAKTIGGDYYDIIPISEERTAICLADVSGKGMPAALLMSNLQAILHSQIFMIAQPKMAMEQTNKLLHQSIGEDKFVTMFYSELNTKTDTLTYTNAGHDPAFVLHNDGTTDHLKDGGLLLGILPDAVFEEGTIVLKQGDVVVLFSDGIPEAINKKNERFGTERLELEIRNMSLANAKTILNSVVQAVEHFVGDVPQFDDITIVVVKKDGKNI